MAQVIIRKAQSRVIRSSQGRVLKQNFQFGKGFLSNVVNAYISVPNVASMISPTLPFTILAWAKPANAHIGIFTLRNALNNVPIDIHFDATNAIETYRATPIGAGTQIGAGGSTQFNFYPEINQRSFVGIDYNGVDSFSRFGNALFESWPYTMESSPFNGLFLGLGQRAGNIYSNGIDEVVVYNRLITTQERLYIYNNRSGNEPATLTGCVGWYHLDKAEILDFSALQNGTDLRAGMRDYSGNNNHGEFVNVPAGTNAERVAYVNNNLLTTL
jgi:hypothetical protein